MIRPSLMAVVLLLAACAHSTSTPVNGPDGAPGWYAITCRNDQSACLEAAGKACPSGYQIAHTADRTTEEPNAAANAFGGFSAGMNGTPAPNYTMQVYQAEMLIKCGAPATPIRPPSAERGPSPGY
ncbi:MAG TPA: hypothetical protein VHS09_01855 [Polyangiaceae bacterium]|jgi:hypothetical protein|nr:hypothetical protein [Polyangiaceae bacterium]